MDLSRTELKVARQFLSPNVRLEVDDFLRTGIPMTTALTRVVRTVLADNKEALHHERRTTTAGRV